VLHYQLASFFPGTIGQATSEDEGFAGEFLTFHDALFGGWADAGFIELFDYFLVGRFGKEFGDGGGYFRTNFGHFEELILCCSG
jgi:hypothetical protein